MVTPGIRHKISAPKPFWLTTLYAEPGLLVLPEKILPVTIDRLSDELLIAAAQFGADYSADGQEARLIGVLLDRLGWLQAEASHVTAALYLPQVQHQRLRALVAAMEKIPDQNRGLAHWAAVAHLTERTAARLFLRDTGLTFGQWRERWRCQQAITALGEGLSVTETALQVGYSDVSSFIAMFCRLTGTTPGKFYAKGRHELP